MFGIHTCCVCRERRAHERACYHCERIGQEVASLGHAIARFVRAKRVEGLVERATAAHYLTVDARGAIEMVSEPARKRHARRNMLKGYADHAEALNELAALALGKGA